MTLTFLTVFVIPIQAQFDQYSNHRSKKVAIVLDQKITLDSLTLDPSYLEIRNVEKDDYDIEFQNNGIIIHRFPAYDSIDIHYRVLNIDVEKPYTTLDSTLLTKKDKAIYIGYDYSPNRDLNADRIINSNKLNYDGSFSRGLSVGNAQSLLLNSNFNLQLAGDLGNDISIKAAISDDNIPIQAEGNTQLLQEFDKVFIEVKRRANTIIAGDYELRRPKSYFINYFKKLQGLGFHNSTQIDQDHLIDTRASFAVSKGKFARTQLEISEGNQGPYKLNGINGELFIIVLSGSERVYLDGQLLTRGQENDYTISYDRAEIIFTPKTLITKDIRIIVEYEYSERNYLRSLYTVESNYQFKNLGVRFNFFSQQDSKSTTGQIDLDAQDVSILQNSGDNFENAVRPGYQAFNDAELNNQILYTLVENPTMGLDSILVYASDPSNGMFTARFTEVGQGNGSYVIDNEVFANGRVYKYIGENQGNYLPIVQLIAPQQNQMLSLAADYNIGESLLVKSEFSLSNNDLNRFSNLDNEDNIGVAGFLELGHNHTLNENWSLKNFANIELTQKEFRALNPYRAQEFNRDWNVESNLDSRESIAGLGSTLSYKNKGNIAYQLKSYNREDFDGLRHFASFQYRDSSYVIDANVNYLKSSSNIENTDFLRPTVEVSRKFNALNQLTLGAFYQGERNERISVGNNELRATSFQFDRINLFIQNELDSRLHYKFSLNRRYDQLPDQNELKEVTIADEFISTSKWNINPSSSLNFDFSYRNLKVQDPILSTEVPRKTYLGRLDFNFSAFDGGVRSLTSYQIQSGQELKQEFEYIQVEQGQGNFVWVDYNADSLRQQNEFEFSPIDTADYLKITVFNNEFIRTNSNGINQSLRLDAKPFISNQSSSFFLNTLSKFSSLHTLRINQKTNAENSNDGFRLVDFDVEDTTLVSFGSFINNTLYFNRSNPKYDLQVGNILNQNKIVQITGFDARALEEYFTRWRLSPVSYMDIIFEAKTGIKLSDSEIFDNRDFSIRSLQLSPEISYRPKTNLRFKTRYTYIEKDQQINENESLVSHNLSFETSYRQANSSSLNLGLSFVQLDFQGDTNTPVSFDMLEGLQQGQNYIWTMAYTRRLNNSVDLIVNYEGRKTGTSRVVHIGRAQVKASF